MGCINADRNEQELRRKEIAMDIKKKFNPSTLLRAGEMSVLAPLLTIYTLVYLGLMIYDFAWL